jgi:SAM-dependent methyltransferase
MATTWPKTFPPLTAEQEAIRDDFMQQWLQELGSRSRYSMIERFNQTYPITHAPATFVRTLEVGAGLGAHLAHETLTAEQRANYYALDLRENISAELKRRVPDVNVVTADCQERLPFADGYFDRVLAIHVLEHLPNLPAAIAELRRVCADHGQLSVVIPCEGSVAYGIGRRLSAQRIFEKRYKQPYRWFIEREHLSVPAEIVHEIERHFSVRHRAFFPIPLPMEWCNLVIGLTCSPRTA